MEGQVYEGYEGLAAAIVERAVMDHRLAMKRLKKDSFDGEGLSTKREVENFFKSEWFSMLCSIDCKKILEELRKK